MESDNECRPLLHSFERESWRSRMRKRCMRIPSEVTITGVILGLFLLVVTLLIVLENMETSNKNELTLDSNLLSSPYKYNKKAIDESWQNKKESMKTKKESKHKKWDNVDKGWKKINDPSGLGNKDAAFDLYKFLEKGEDPELKINLDEYGKETEDSLEILLDQDLRFANSMINDEVDETETMNLLQTSKIKWKKIDDGWKKLSEQGWKNKQIKEALITALREYQNETAETLQSSMSLDDFWDSLNDFWKKNMKKGMEEKELKESLLLALREFQNETVATLQSAMNFDDFWDTINDKWEKNIEKGSKEKEKQKDMNDKWKNKMNILQSPNSSSKKGEKHDDDDGLKELLDNGWKEKDIEDAIISALNGQQKALKVAMGVQNLWGKAISMIKNLLQKGTADSQKSTNNKWEDGMKLLMSSPKSDKLKDDKGWKFLLKQGWKKKEVKEALITALEEKEDSLTPPTSFKNFIDDIIQSIQDRQREYRIKSTTDGAVRFNQLMQSSIPTKKEDEDNIGGGITKLLKEGWSIAEIKEAIYKAWKENKKHKKESMGDYGSMKWKKVNEGWKKISINS